MNNESIFELCKQLKLAYVNDLIASSDDKLKEYTHKLLAAEIEGRKRAKLGKLLRDSNIPKIKTFEGYRFEEIIFPSACNKDRLLSLDWISSKENMVMIGNVGAGNYRKFLLIERFLKKSSNILFLY